MLAKACTCTLGFRLRLCPLRCVLRQVSPLLPSPHKEKKEKNLSALRIHAVCQVQSRAGAGERWPPTPISHQGRDG